MHAHQAISFCIILLITAAPISTTCAKTITRTFLVSTGTTRVETGLAPAANNSISVICDNRQLNSPAEYEFDLRTGVLTLTGSPSCDSLVVSVFLLPDWLITTAGNPVPEGKKFIQSLVPIQVQPPASASELDKIKLSGNKSFLFSVGRSGAGRFSQGLNLDFEALLAKNLQIRGAVADRGTAASPYRAGDGETIALSELDKYYFEISGTRIAARGGDITIPQGNFLPAKRITGLAAQYSDSTTQTGIRLGRPSGKFTSASFLGIDGRQGPYQLQYNNAPTGVVSGSERVYLDGQLLDGGGGRHYQIDYPAGRITFSPGILITSRSRIEIDFEAAEQSFQQEIYDGSTQWRLAGGKLNLRAGGRRETDDKDRLRFGALSAADVAILESVGDSIERAFTPGAQAQPGGGYEVLTDSSGNDYYRYAGSGAGDHSVTFTYLGAGRGDYRYLGDGIYDYAGQGLGDYAAVILLPAPSRTDYLFGSAEIMLYGEGKILLNYQGNSRDKNLFSRTDDGDNLKHQLQAEIAHTGNAIESAYSIRFRQGGFSPSARTDLPDYLWHWGLPVSQQTQDDLQLDSRQALNILAGRVEAKAGYLALKDFLRAQRHDISFSFLTERPVSPRGLYQAGHSQGIGGALLQGLYQKYGGGALFKPIRPLKLTFDFTQEFTRQADSSQTSTRKFEEIINTVGFRNTHIEWSQRIDYSDDAGWRKGPRQNRITAKSEESYRQIRLSFTGTWLRQEPLDSDRPDLTMFNYLTSLRYNSNSGSLSLQADYRQNRQGNKSAGYRYLKVDDGQGEYRLENGQYLYDSNGDYLRIREERGDERPSSIAEKNHIISFYPGRLSLPPTINNIARQIAFRVRSEISEEIPDKDRRVISWILPWASRSGIEYTRRVKREVYSAQLFPQANFNILRLEYAGQQEEMDGGRELLRDRKEYQVETKEALSLPVQARQSWRHRRSRESGQGTASSSIIRNEFEVALIVTQAGMQVIPQIGYLRFADRNSSGLGQGFTLAVESIFRRPNRGELRARLEGRSLERIRPFSQPDYLVTDGRLFGQSALIQFSANYDLSGSLRLNLHLTDQIYQDVPSEFAGRGELVVIF